MTAIVGTLNRRGMAFATDSAATFTTSATIKINNNANKLFELSKKHPVGIAIYNSLDFYGIPWEVIFKTYRDVHLKEASFPRLIDYAHDFWNYLHNYILTKISIDEQKRIISFFIQKLKDETIETATNRLNSKGVPINSSSQFGEIMTFLTELEEDYKTYDRTSELKNYPKSRFEEYSNELIDAVLKDLLDDAACPNEFRKKFVMALYSIITVDRIVYLPYTGLVFWGYGEDELFPSYYQFEVSIAFDQNIKYVELSNYEVSNQNIACVAPFAQTDVANTVVRGIDQSLRDNICNNMKVAFNDFRNNIVDALLNAGAPSDLLDALRNINITNQTDIFINDLNNYIRKNYTDKLLNTVAFLSKEDLADMSESLVRMTCLKRHITTDEESVGGPVDVAVVTKGEGFIWIKRKHYFDRELNPHYFNRQ